MKSFSKSNRVEKGNVSHSLFVIFVVLILVQLALAAFQVWNLAEIYRPQPVRAIACFEGYQVGVQVGEEIVPLAAGEHIDPKVNPMVAIYGTYCTEVTP